MGVHLNAWQGLEIVIFGKKPLIPMQIEQSIARVSPGNETRLSSFEDYNDCYDFCSEIRNAGFFFVHEDTGDIPASTAFSNLSNIYKKFSGFSAYGVLIHSGEESVSGWRSMSENKYLTAYISEQQLLDQKIAFYTMENLWDKFANKIEQEFIPDGLQITLKNLANLTGHTFDSQIFIARTMNILAPKLNLSWLQIFALQWVHIIDHLNQTMRDAIRGHSELLSIISNIKGPEIGTSISHIARSGAPLPNRITQTIKILDEWRKKGVLADNFYAEINELKPRDPALLKHLQKCVTRILEFAADCETSAESESEELRGAS